MAERKRQPESGPSPNGWIVTFSDCMTLLLCFFVLLLTFSSFDDVTRRQLAGAFQCRSFDAIFPQRQAPKEAVVRPFDSPFDITAHGSEKPTPDPLKAVDKPRRPLEVLDTGVFDDRRVFYLSSEDLFWGRGTALTEPGRQHLGRLAELMRSVPCRVILAESSEHGGGRVRPGLGLDRAWTLLDYFVSAERLAEQRFQLATMPPETARRFAGQPVVQVTLLAEDAYE